MRFEVLRAVNVRTVILWILISCSTGIPYQTFGGTSCPEDEINKIQAYIKNRIIRNLYRGINEYKRATSLELNW
jgi:hypothetical protein